MKNLNIVIVEEDPKVVENLCEILEYLNHQVVGEASNTKDALRLIEERNPNFLIINICVNAKSDGILLGRKVKEDYDIPFIFTSSDADDTELIHKAIEEKPYGFVLKPYSIKDIDTAIQIAFNQFEELSRLEFNLLSKPSRELTHIFLKVNSKLININLKDILWIESKGDYAVFKTENDSFIIHSTMKNIETKLSNSQFLKVHRSFIINLDKIVNIEDSNLLIKDKIIPISRGNKDSLLRSIHML
ncbi:response regulator transcription factor [Reichenbachiella sp. MALMAid0571]|uniref:LytR/AlgR family response regulator transcription factor n=1 Tax=Reichenbachiella sp. MALMAid0571 TaxID=3143939 RepID=UPI0032DEFE5E